MESAVEPRVFPTQSTNHDLSKASDHGKLLPGISYMDYTGSPSSYAGVRAALTDFNPSLDFLLPIGDPINIGLAFTALYRLGHTKIQVLKWNRIRSRYYPLTVTLDQIKWTVPEREE
jgi:hypothetical protein